MSLSLQPSLITSFRPLSTVKALRELGALERRVAQGLSPPRRVSVDCVDLYCFGREDPEELLPGHEIPPPGHIVAWLASLQPGAIKQIGSSITALLGRRWRKRRKVACLATYLPSLSVPSGHPDGDNSAQTRSIQALKSLVLLAEQLGASCVEIVCGADFVRRGGKPEEWQTSVGRRPRDERRSALCEALAELETWIAGRRWAQPVGLALELEPGLSYCLNAGEEIVRLFEQLDHRVGGRAQHVALNLDLGHAFLLSIRDPGLRALLWDHFPDRIAHAHISRHVPPAHFADLAIDRSILEGLDTWIELFAFSQDSRNRCRFATASIAVELEAAVPPTAAIQSYLALQGWLTK